MNTLYQPFQPILAEAGLRSFDISLDETPACGVLKGVVHSYLQISSAKAMSYAVIPDGTQAIFISSNGSVIGGVQSQASEVPILKPGDYFGVRFYPGALRHFFDLNLVEISDTYVDSQYFPCKYFTGLHNKIYGCERFSQRADVCEQWLLKNFSPKGATPFDFALSLIYQSLGNIKINELAKSVGWSSRHLNRLFQHHVGLSTKAFSQIIRIQYACKQLCLSNGDSSKAALNLGFFDQAHLLNEFKKRLLTNPNEFLNRFRSDFYNS